MALPKTTSRSLILLATIFFNVFVPWGHCRPFFSSKAPSISSPPGFPSYTFFNVQDVVTVRRKGSKRGRSGGRLNPRDDHVDGGSKGSALVRRMLGFGRSNTGTAPAPAPPTGKILAEFTRSKTFIGTLSKTDITCLKDRLRLDKSGEKMPLDEMMKYVVKDVFNLPLTRLKTITFAKVKSKPMKAILEEARKSKGAANASKWSLLPTDPAWNQIQNMRYYRTAAAVANEAGKHISRIKVQHPPVESTKYKKAKGPKVVFVLAEGSGAQSDNEGQQGGQEENGDANRGNPAGGEGGQSEQEGLQNEEGGRFGGGNNRFQDEEENRSGGHNNNEEGGRFGGHGGGRFGGHEEGQDGGQEKGQDGGDQEGEGRGPGRGHSGGGW